MTPEKRKEVRKSLGQAINLVKDEWDKNGEDFLAIACYRTLRAIQKSLYDYDVNEDIELEVFSDIKESALCFQKHYGVDDKEFLFLLGIRR